VRLFSIQPRFVYDVLLSEGRFLSQPMKAGDDWDFADTPAAVIAYDWLCREMEERGLARPPGDRVPPDRIYPLWAWQQYLGPAKPKPDLRSSEMKHWGSMERHVLLTLDVPDHEVLLHDYEAWHFPLNHWYLGTSKASNDFERRCKRAGCPAFSEVPLRDAALREELEASWRLIFDLKAIKRKTSGSADTQIIQATFWELRADQVVSAVEFGLGKTRQVLALPPRPLPADARRRCPKGIRAEHSTSCGHEIPHRPSERNPPAAPSTMV
jgi:hypothetical protein